jgi:hypothetical protein
MRFVSASLAAILAIEVSASHLIAHEQVAPQEDLSSATAPLPPGTFTTSAHSDQWKITNALSAAPLSLPPTPRWSTGLPIRRVDTRTAEYFGKGATVGPVCQTFPEDLSMIPCALMRRR